MEEDSDRPALGNLSNVAPIPNAPTELHWTLPVLHFDYLSDSDEDEDVPRAHTQQQHPFPSQTFTPLGATAIALAREPRARALKRPRPTLPPQRPKPKAQPKVRSRGSNKKAAPANNSNPKVVSDPQVASTIAVASKPARSSSPTVVSTLPVVATSTTGITRSGRRARSSGPTVVDVYSPTPEPEDYESEYEDEPAGPSRKRGRRSVPQIKRKQNEDAKPTPSSSRLTSIPTAELGPSSIATTTIVEVGKHKKRVEITQLKNGHWICPHREDEGCLHTTDKSHDMGRHLETLAHLRKEWECKVCKQTFTRSDAHKRHVKGRCPGPGK